MKERFLPFLPKASQIEGQVTVRFQRRTPAGQERWVSITGAGPAEQVRNLVLRPTPVRKRTRGGLDDVTGFYLDRGIFNNWRFQGTRGSDALFLGPQGHIITKGLGGLFNMGRDNVRDEFTFTNTINVQRISAIFGRPISALNHLSGVKITNFGQEDVITLQGKTFTWNDVDKSTGTIPGVEASRLQISFQA